MDFKNIKQLAKILNESGLTAIEVAEGESKIRLEKNNATSTVQPHLPVMPVATVMNDAFDKTDIKQEKQVENTIDFNRIEEIKSPMVGIFYAASSPDAKPFVEVGSKVKKGDTLCVIEAMKIMNEITATHDGEVVDICAQNGQVVEFSQTLFKIF